MPIYGRGPIDEVTSPDPTDHMSTNEDSNHNSPYDFLQCCHPNATSKSVRAEELYRGISINTDMNSIAIDAVDNENDDETDLSYPSINSPREKGQLLSKRQRTANMSDMNSLKNGNMRNGAWANSDDEDDFIAKRDPRKRERKNSVSAYGQARHSARLLNKIHNHDHNQCTMYSSTSGIDSQSTNDSTSNLNEFADSKNSDAEKFKVFNINEILCEHCKICSPCRNATLSPEKYKLFKKIKLVTNEGCDSVEMAAPFIITETSDETTPKESSMVDGPSTADSSFTKTPSKNDTIYVNENSHCPTLFHQGAKSDTMLTCRKTRKNRKRPAECIDQNFKSVPTSRFL